MICSFIIPVFAEYGLTFEQFMTTYVDVLEQQQPVPDSYRYIQLQYPNISQDMDFYDILQKAVYLDLLPNARVHLPLDKHITQEHAKNIITRSFDFAIRADKKGLVTVDWLRDIFLRIQKIQSESLPSQDISSLSETPINNRLLLDVYKRLKFSYLSDSGLDEKSLLYGTIK